MIQVFEVVGDHDDRTAVLGQLLHAVHDVLFELHVQAGGGLVQEEHGRLGQQLKRDVDPFLLAPGQRRGRGVRGRLRAVLRGLVELELVEDLLDPDAALLVRGVTGESQLGRVAEGAARGQMGIDDILLGHQADPVPQFGVMRVEIAVVVQDRALGRGRHPGQGAE